jgi:hypothetical protein
MGVGRLRAFRLMHHSNWNKIHLRELDLRIRTQLLQRMNRRKVVILSY